MDLALIGKYIHGFEIKSALDTLQRLPAQQMIYNRTLDFVTIVAEEPHMTAIPGAVPDWWGITEVVPDEDSGIRLILRRQPKHNPDIDPYSLAQLLWREESLRILDELGLLKGLRRSPRRELWRALAINLDVDSLRTRVVSCILQRRGWRDRNRRR